MNVARMTGESDLLFVQIAFDCPRDEKDFNNVPAGYYAQD